MRTEFDRVLFVLGAVTGMVLALNEVRFDVHMPLGGDFAQIWLAGYLTSHGQMAALYDPERFSQAGLSLIDNFYHPKAYWSYPPATLLFAVPLGLLPYKAALALFTLAQAALAAVTAVTVTRERLSPAVAATIALTSAALMLSAAFGQFSVLVAGCLLLGVFHLEKQPGVAGVLFALAAVKPQFGLLIPLALLAAKEWRAFASAAVTILGLVAASVGAFGIEAWVDCVTKTLPQQAAFIGDLHAYGPVAHSVRDTLLLAGAAKPLASLAQWAASAVAIAGVGLVFARNRDAHVRAFVLTVAAVSVLPYANLYDAALPAFGALALYGHPGERAPGMPAPWMLIAVFVLWLGPAADAVLGLLGLFKFVPLFGAIVLGLAAYGICREADARQPSPVL